MARPPELIPTGVPGLDTVLQGGMPRGRMYLVQGPAGSGKTTLGLQFALAGVRAGERAQYISLAETRAEIEAIAASHGWSTEGLPIRFQDAVAGGEGGEVQTVLHPAEVELPATVDAVLDQVEAAQPDRLVLDSLAEIRLMVRESRWYRREMVRMRTRLEALDCTVLVTDTADISQAAETLLGNVFRLESRTPEYGPDRRRIHVAKMRGHDYETGYHDVRIRRGGMCVYPRLVAARHRELADSGTVSMGIERLDGLLGGGLDRGTATFLLGPTGTGRSTVALRCAVAAAERGEKVLVHVFDERLHTLHKRARSVGLDVQSHVEAGRIVLQQTDPAEVTPGEFADSVRRHAEDGGLDLLVLDSLNAYLYAMPDEHLLHLHLHELLSYLSRQGVSSLLVATEHGAGDDVRLPEQLDVAYLADTVVYFERLADGGRPKRTLTVCKRRGGEHDARRRDLDITERGIEIGEPRGAPDRVPTSDIAGPES